MKCPECNETIDKSTIKNVETGLFTAIYDCGKCKTRLRNNVYSDLSRILGLTLFTFGLLSSGGSWPALSPLNSILLVIVGVSVFAFGVMRYKYAVRVDK